jgi:glycosyltransferase involved in cell wall biosynthesis
MLTVAMPVFNGMPYLRAAVESILAQTFSDFVFVIVDDGSTDGSREYLGSLRDPRIRLYCEERRGATAARNRLIQLTETGLCALMDADDVAIPTRLQAQWDFMRVRSEVVLLGTQIAFMAGNRFFARSPFPTEHSEVVRHLVKTSPVICHPSCMFRTEAVRTIRGYRLLWGEEFDLFLRLSEIGLLANLGDILHTYRIHLGSTFATQYPKYVAYIAYAVACHRSRLSGQPEPTVTEFLMAWNNQSIVRQMFRRLDTWSALEFRRGLLQLGRGARLKGSALMIASAICRPRSALLQATSLLNQILTVSWPRNSINAKSDKSAPSQVRV